jgi:DNA-directed RNA polymerase specialized sigma24 family protein
MERTAAAATALRAKENLAMTHIPSLAPEDKQLSEDAAAELIGALRSSPERLETLLYRYRNAGFSNREIVAAMAASPRLVNAIGRRR